MENKEKSYSIILISITVALLLIFISSTISAASPTISETRITNSGHAYNPAIYGDTIVWDDQRNGINSLYIYKISTSEEIQISSNGSGGNPAIYGNRIVWQDGRKGNSDIYMHNLSTHQEIQISYSGLAYRPKIYDNRIVWQDMRNSRWDIYMYDLSTNKETQITNSGKAMMPAIYGDRIVWSDYRNGKGDLYMYDLDTSQETRLISSDSEDQYYPQIYGDRVVWYNYLIGNTDCNIHMYDISTSQKTQITTDKSNHYLPAICNDRIVWQDNRNGVYNIYMYNLSSSQETRITTNPASYPAIYDNRIVWQDYRNGNGCDIYMAAVSEEGQELINGSLVQVKDNSEVYLIKDGKKCHYTSPEALLWNGRSFSEVITVTNEILQKYPDGDNISISQPIIDKYKSLGGAPIFGSSAGTGELKGDQDSTGVYCSYVNFEKGAIECFQEGAHKGKAYAIIDQFFVKWASMGYGKSVLGYPIGDMSEERTSSKNTPYKYQLFTNGTQLGALEWNLNTNQVFEVHGAIFAKWAEIGFASSVLGLPTGDEQNIASSKYGTVGRYGTFENGHIHWNKVTGLSFVTYGALNECYNNIQGTQSDLGFPIMNQVGTTDGHDYCEFEKGFIELNANSGEYVPNYSPNINQRIDAKLKAKPNFPQYLLDPDYVGSVTVVSLEFADRVLDFFYSDNTDMREQYNKLYSDGIRYYGIRNSYLYNAKQSLKNNDITSAEEFLGRADKMQKCSEMSFQAANDVFVGSTESAEILAQGVRDECEFIADASIAYAGGSLSIIKNADKYKDMMDATFTFIDLYKAQQTGGNDELAKQIFIKGLTYYIVNEIQFEELGGRTFEEATKAAPTDIDENAISHYLLNEELTGKLITFSPEVHKVIIDLGVAEGLYLEDRFIDEGLNAMLEHMAYVSGNPYEMAIVASPVELRIYDSAGRVTGLVDGVVKNEIPNSMYESDLEIVFIYNATDTYRYETVGTANATYGLKIVHYENMMDKEIILTDVPITTNIKHTYDVDWENEAQVNKTVTIDEELISPQSINNLQYTNGTTWLNWTWINPTDPYFDHTEIYLNGIFQTKTSAEYFNDTGLQPETSYIISTRTVDKNGNVNETWVNSTATTEKVVVPIIPVANFTSNVTEGSAPLNVQFTDLSENASEVSWDFDNNGVIDSKDRKPLYQYAVPGIYTVNLTASNINGTTSKLATITVLEEPMGFSNKVTLGDMSPISPALASLNGRLYLAWKGNGNNNLNVMYSTDDGKTFGNKYTSSETSPQSPSLCVHDGHLYIAWKGNGNNKLNVAQVTMNGDKITGLSNKVTLGDMSPISPALASFNGRLYLAWKGNGNNLNVMYSMDGGKTLGNKYTSSETSPQSPSLCVHNGNLYISWKGNGNNKLNVAQVTINGDKITGLSNKVTLGDTSPISPALASFNDRLYLAWKGNSNNNLNVMYSTDGGKTFGNKYTSPETSVQSPALCAHNGHLYIAWKGNGNNKLNIAQVI